MPIERDWVEGESHKKEDSEIIVFDVSRIEDSILSALKEGQKVKIVHPISFAYMSPMLGFAFELETLAN